MVLVKLTFHLLEKHSGLMVYLKAQIKYLTWITDDVGLNDNNPCLECCQSIPSLYNILLHVLGLLAEVNIILSHY